jgi:hydroxymethylbilane synthase
VFDWWRPYRGWVLQVRLATRGSEQALAQSTKVADLLRQLGHEVELVRIETKGDAVRDRPIWEIGGTGVFVKEVQRAVTDGRADLAVHSAKDLPSSFHAEGLTLACVPLRGDPRDAMVGSTLANLRHGAVIATGSRRRQAQLANVRPDLNFTSLRGNIPTRIAKAEESGIDASLVAVAGAVMVGLQGKLDDIFDVETMVPQIGQGALAIECRTDDVSLRQELHKLEHRDSRRAVDAERTFLARLGGGCELPVGAYATVQGNEIRITGVIASVDGSELYRDTLIGAQVSVGADLADRLLKLGGAALIG